MKGILNDVDKTADEQALYQIARAAEGGMRDALSLLDQCLMVSEHLALEDVYRVIGFVGGQSVEKLLSAFEAQDVASMLTVIDEVAKSGANLEVFARECMQTLRDNLVRSDIHHQARYGYAIEVLAQAQSQMRYSPRPRVLLDAAAVRLCMPQGENSQAALLARIESLEARLDKYEKQPFVAAVEKPQAEQDAQSHKSAAVKRPVSTPPWEEDQAPPPWGEDAPPFEANRR